MLFSHACLKMCSNETVRMKLSSPQIGAQFYRTFLPKFMQENRRPPQANQSAVIEEAIHVRACGLAHSIDACAHKIRKMRVYLVENSNANISHSKAAIF